jgi:hypothetical protein
MAASTALQWYQQLLQRPQICWGPYGNLPQLQVHHNLNH